MYLKIEGIELFPFAVQNDTAVLQTASRLIIIQTLVICSAFVHNL